MRAGHDATTNYSLTDPLDVDVPNDSVHLLHKLDFPSTNERTKCITPSHKLTSKVKRFRCKYCSLTFIRTTELLKHLIFHTGDTRNQCKKCKLVLSSAERLEKHMKTHDASGDGANFQCDMCGVNGFESKRRLAAHIRLHLKVCIEKPLQQSSSSTDGDNKLNEALNCERCRKQFYRKSNFNSHIKRHYICMQTDFTNMKTGAAAKTHLCPICGKLFSYKAHLNRHLSIHTETSI